MTNPDTYTLHDEINRLRLENKQLRSQLLMQPGTPAGRPGQLITDTLVELLLAIISQTDTEVILNRILHQVEQLVPFQAANLMLVQNEQLQVVRWLGQPPYDLLDGMVEEKKTLAIQPLDLQVIESNQPMVVSDTRQNDRWVGSPASSWIRSFLTMPVSFDQKVVGLVRLYSDSPNAFSMLDARWLQPLTNAIATALENARLYGQLRAELVHSAEVEASLQRTTTRTQAILNAIPDSLIFVDRTGQVLDYKLQADDEIALTGQFRQQAAPTKLEQLLPPEITQEVQQQIEVTLASGQVQLLEFSLPDRIIHQEYEARLVVSGTDEVLIVLRDITTRKQSEQQAVRSERLAALGRLSAALAHELNNPLQIVQSHLDLVLKYPINADETQEALAIVHRNVDRMRDSCQQILNFAQPAQATQNPVKMDHIVKQVLELLQKELEKSNIQLTKNIAQVSTIMAAPAQLSQVILNLMINALEALPQGGKIDVAVYDENDAAVVSITDDGPAIAPEILPHIFEPFVSDKPDGSGLGLWISHNIIEQHKGSLVAENLTPEKGVAFTIKLPVFRRRRRATHN
jgi:PAS domain S-box-containing protein